MRKVIVLATLSVTAVLAAQSQRHEDSSLHYSFQVPDGWERIPPDVLQYTFAEVARATGMPQQHYAVGFQRDAPTWLAYPYLLVQHHPVNSATFNEIAKALGGVTGGVTEQFKGKDIVSDLQFGEPTSHPARQMVLMPLSLNVTGVGPVRGLSVMKPGRDGLVQMTLYARAAEYAATSAEFESIINSLVFAPGYDYGQSPAARSFDWSKVIRGAIVGAVIAAIIGLLAYLRRR